jgi:hypothetical protein
MQNLSENIAGGSFPPPLFSKSLLDIYKDIVMPFQASASYTGVPDFKIIKINPEETAKAFQTYLDTASSLTGVSLDDINRTVVTLPHDAKKATLVELLNCGMKLFDAVVWLTAGRPESHPLMRDPGQKDATVPTMHEIARSVFYCYFMLLTQARYPVSSRETQKPKIPNFLKTIMRMDKDQHVYVEMISSFEPNKFDPAWVRFVSFENFGQEVMSRFGLGVAGYRMFGPFGLYDPKSDMDPALRPAFDFARTVAKKPASWNVHPLTRNPNILKARGNLNKNLGNLILRCFSAEDIEEMKKARILYDTPVKEVTHRQYITWTADDDITGTSLIFPKEVNP